MVARLMSPDSNGWNVDVLRATFIPADVDRILRTPVSPDCNDAWFWRKDFLGSYTVRSGYKLNTEIGMQTRDFHAWNKLWKINVAPKIRSFLWRCIMKVIPVCSALRGRRVEVEAECPLCSNMEETWTHLVFEWPVIKQVWAEVGLESIFNGQHFNTWFETLLDTNEASTCCWCSMLLWFVWNARNDGIWNGKRFSPSGVANAASSYMEAWNRAKSKVGREIRTAQPSTSTEYTTRRCYVDAALFARKNLVWIGLALVNEEGLVMAAKSALLQCTMDPYYAEIMACKEALTWIKDNGWRDVRVYSDCLNACNKVNGSLMDRSYAGAAIAECRMIIRELQGVSIRYIPRVENTLAHGLAKNAEQRMVTKDWVFNPPQCTTELFDAI